MVKYWSLIEADLHQFYRIDIQSGILRQRSYKWLIVRIRSLLALPPTFTPDGRPVHASRLGLAAFPPEPPRKT